MEKTWSEAKHIHDEFLGFVVTVLFFSNIMRFGGKRLRKE